MHASLVRRTSRLAVIAVAAAAAGTLAWAPAEAASEQADRYGPGYAIPDSDGNPGASHIGAYGPPGMTVQGQLETYCADPERKGPDSAGGYTGPTTVDHWTSSVSGKQVPDVNLAYTSYVMGRYGQTRDAAQAAAVDAAVYQLLAGGTYGIDGARGKQRLAYPNVSPTARTLALGYLAEAKRFAGPYRLTLTPTVNQTSAGKQVTVTVAVADVLSGAKVPGVQVALSESGTGAGSSGRVTTGPDGSASWEFTADARGTAAVHAAATGLPGSQLKVLSPRTSTAQRLLLAGDTTTAAADTSVKVTAAPGGLTIHKKDPSGHAMAGATFDLIDAGGKTAARGTTGADGTLAFDGLAPGTYRLHETSPGDRIHATAPDQDVTITEGKDAAANPISIIDPFKQGELLVKKIDKATGKPLAGAVITINADTADASDHHTKGKEIARLTTGKDGTATLALDVTATNGTSYWASEASPPPGYDTNAPAQRFTAAPATQVTLTFSDTKTPAVPSTPPTTAPAPAAPSVPAAGTQLAHTGSADTSWLVGSAGLLVTAGGGTLWAGSRRRRTTNSRP
jgi:hypothetical protein